MRDQIEHGRDSPQITPIAREHTRVLLVDDDQGLLRTLQILLEDEGSYRIFTAGSGEQALEILSREDGIVIVLTDISMPGISGPELCRVMETRYPRVVKVLMTAHRWTLGDMELRETGAKSCLAKPIDPAQLLELLEKLCTQAR